MNNRYERMIELALLLFIAISLYTSVNPVSFAEAITENLSFALTRVSSLPPRLVPARSH